MADAGRNNAGPHRDRAAVNDNRQLPIRVSALCDRHMQRQVDDLALVLQEREQNRKVLRPHTNVTTEAEYMAAISQGHTKVCFCCVRLHLPSSVSQYTVGQLRTKGLSEQLIAKSCHWAVKRVGGRNLRDDLAIQLCTACKRDVVKRRRLPLLCTVTYELPEVPEVLQELNRTEELLISRALAFTQLHLLKYPLAAKGDDEQNNLCHHIIYIPPREEAATFATVLPRKLSEASLIQFRLGEGKADDKNSIYRPEVDMNHNSVSNETLILNINDVLGRPLGKTSGRPARLTLLDDRFVSVSDYEYACFLKAYGGMVPQVLVADGVLAKATKVPFINSGRKKATYSQLSKYELRHYERRSVRADHIFFKLCKLMLETINRRATSCTNLRMRRGDNAKIITAGQALNKAFIEPLVSEDKDYEKLQHNRGTSAYWMGKKQDLKSMIRQLGPPTFFLTLKQAQLKWPELLVILKEALDGEVISREQAAALSYDEKTDLISRDPVTCVLYFEWRIRALLGLMSSAESPFGRPVVDYNYRIKFDSTSGTPFVHCLLWMDNGDCAPLPKVNIKNLTAESTRQCKAFVDQHITCSRGTTEDEQKLVRTFQIHRHSFKCERYKLIKTEEDYVENDEAKVCRFAFPAPPMPQTMLLQPLSKAEKTANVARRWETILAFLETATEQQLKNMSFDQFLAKIGKLNETQYLQAVRYSLKQPKIFLKRTVEEIWIYAYNPTILRLHRATMDIQFVLDPYACATYISKNTSKAFSHGLSRSLQQLVEEARRGESSVLDRLKAVAGRFYNSCEISVSEAIYHILDLSFFECSRRVCFINTDRPKQRKRLLRPLAELKQLPTTSTDIYAPNRIIYYMGRSEQLEDLCLADVITQYEVVATGAVDEEAAEVGDEVEGPIDSDEESGGKVAVAPPTQANFPISGFPTRQHKQLSGKARVLRSCQFSELYNTDNYYREQLMLYVPWRKEDDFSNLSSAALKELYKAQQKVIEANRRRYSSTDNWFANEVNKLAFKKIEENEDDEDYSEDEEIASIAEFDINYPRERQQAPQWQPSTAEECAELIASLNEEQRRLVRETLNSLKQDKPFYLFINGGFGIGKSYLVKTLECLINNHLAKAVAGTEVPATNQVILCAPTGMAAYHIGGSLIHYEFQLAGGDCDKYVKHLPRLNPSQMNTLSTKLKGAKVVIVYQANLVGSGMLAQMNIRCNQAYNQPDNMLPFGGKLSVIMVGDLHQLPPLGDRWIYEPVNKNRPSALADTWLFKHFKLINLKTVMFQQDGDCFAQRLNEFCLN